MRGDPDFDRSRLSDLERYHFDRLWREIEDPDNAREVTRRAESDDLFTYGRWLQGHIQAVLTAFRVTGDLALLDHVDEVAEVMRAQLDYGWRDRPDGTDGTRGEFLLWVFRYGSGPSFYGTDNRIDDMKTHALVAMFAYAFDLNRDLASPGGRDYAASADFWKAYLEQFEAKLRVDGPASGFPITTHPDTHTWYSWTKWHYYMWKLTGDRAYLDEANRMADVLWADIRVVELDEGPAYVWTSNIAQESDRRQYLMTTPYANSVFGDVVTFHLEGFHEWAYTEHITAYARTLTHFVFDSEDVLSHGVAADIGGDADRAGIPSDSGRPRRDAVGFADYQFALIAPWDESGRVARVAYEVQETFTERDTTRVAAGLLLGAHLEPQATASAIASASP